MASLTKEFESADAIGLESPLGRVPTAQINIHGLQLPLKGVLANLSVKVGAL